MDEASSMIRVQLDSRPEVRREGGREEGGEDIWVKVRLFSFSV